MTLNTRAVVSPLVILSLLALGGCEEKKTEQWYMAHHDELIKDYANCLQTHTFTSDRCVPVVNAAKRAKHEPDVAAGIKRVRKEYLESTTLPENPIS